MKPKLHEPTWAADPQNDPIGWKEENSVASDLVFTTTDTGRLQT